MTVKLSNANTTIQLKDIVDIVFVKNKSPALAPETYPVYLRVMPFEKPVIIYAKSKDKKILKSLSYLSYLCQHKEDSL